MNTKYRIVLTCWVYGKRAPYSYSHMQLYRSQEEAFDVIQDEVQRELNTLNEKGSPNADHFKVSYGGEHLGIKFDAITRLWEYADDVEGDNEYYPVTGYNIIPVIQESSTTYKYRGCYICKRKKEFVIEQMGVKICSCPTLPEALACVDEKMLELKIKLNESIFKETNNENN